MFPEPTKAGSAAVALAIVLQFSRAAAETFRVRDDGVANCILQAFLTVGVAEIFDKTWFVTLILALKYGWQFAFTSSFLALVVHVLMAALLGFSIATFFKPSTLDFMTAGIFAVFAALYFKDYLYADSNTDMISAGKEEAGECVESPPENYGSADSSSQKNGKHQSASTSLFLNKSVRRFGNCFLIVFIAEWGDRTQIAMIGLHASMPVVPVCLGSVLAFFLLCLSAAVLASYLEKYQLSERLVMGLVCLSFVFFTILAVQDGLVALQLEKQAIKAL